MDKPEGARADAPIAAAAGGPDAGAEAVPGGHVVLVGLMGTGKSTVGRILADRLHRRLVDSDELIEARTGRTVREIFATDGEAAFRSLEEAALLDALADPEPLVIAAAGGVVLSAANRAALRSTPAAVVVWLHAPPDLLVPRALAGVHRPLLDGDAGGTLRRMAREREPLYRDVADVAVDTAQRDPDAVADEVVAILARRSGGRR